jgi:cell division protein FtsW (lipid II flippase)
VTQRQTRVKPQEKADLLAIAGVVAALLVLLALLPDAGTIAALVVLIAGTFIDRIGEESADAFAGLVRDFVRGD